MKIVIAGAGNAGTKLAEHMRGARFSIVMLDISQNALDAAEETLDVMTVNGSASDPAALAKSGAFGADLFAALTDDEETNVLSCIFAKHGGARRVIAKLSSPQFHRTNDAPVSLNAMGVDLAINQKAAVAEEIFRVLSLPVAAESFDLFGGRAIVAGFPVGAASPLAGITPANIPDREIVGRMRFIALLRGEKVVIPRGDTVFRTGDTAYIAGATDDVKAFSAWLEPERKPFRKVVIAGGGGVGFFVAEKLEARGGVEIVLLEQSDERAAFCAERLDKTLVLKADALCGSTLDEAGIDGGETAFVAVTGDDERNTMNCLMARDKGAVFTVAQIARAEYAPIVEGLGVASRAISPFESIARGIMHYLRGKNTRMASLPHNLPGELLDVEVADKHKFAGKTLKDIKFPRDMNVAVALRKNEVIPTNGDFALQPGDRLLVFAEASAVEKVNELFL